MKIEYDKKVQGNGGKNILVIGCVHGDELIGERVIKELRKFVVLKGTLVTVVANTRAMEAGVRFINEDLNRVFPGNSQGNHEEQLACSLIPLLKESDIVLDIHSTTTDTTSVIILTKVNQSIRKLLSIFNPRRVVVMGKEVGKTALTGYCKTGISFEYGKDKSEKAYRETLSDILKILERYQMIGEDKKNMPKIKQRTEYFEVLGTLARPAGLKLDKKIKNFSLVKKNEIIASSGVNTQKSPRNFYPFLFGPVSYKEIWGFMTKKVKEI